MNTSWFEEFLADEWSDWDYTTFKKYQLTDKEIFFGWWITGDIQEQEGAINLLFEVIKKAKEGEEGEFKGNSYEAIFTKQKVYILNLQSKQQHQYTVEELEQALLEWEFMLKSKGK